MATICQCNPISRAWDRSSGKGTCINIGVLWYANAIYNILTDFTIVLMVPPVVFKLKLPVRQKLALSGIFGLGLIVCAASIFRLTTLYSSAYGDDITAGSLVSTIWTTVESGLGVVTMNLPMLRTPLQHFFPRLFPSRTATDRISSRDVSRPSRWSINETFASPTKLIPPPIPTRKISSPALADTLHAQETPVLINLCEGGTKLRQDSRTAIRQDIEVQGRRFDHGQRLQHSLEHIESGGWYGHSHKVW
jgi:hypothetical protein